MAIKQVQADKPTSAGKVILPNGSAKEEGKEQETLLAITLPVARSGDPNEFLKIGQHNICGKRNFQEVGKVLLATISNQKLMSMAITKLGEEIKDLQEAQKTIAENIRELLKEEKKNGKQKPG